MENPSEIPKDIIEKWKGIVITITNIMNVSDAVITKIELPYFEPLLVSQKESLFKMGDRKEIAGHYCEDVIKNGKKLLVPNALKDEKWKANPGVKLGLISYLGLPLKWPNGEIFGTICIHDKKENYFSEKIEIIMKQFRELIEAHLEILYKNIKLEESNREFNMLCNEMNDGLFLHKIKNLKYSRFIKVNNFATHKLGYSREELLKMSPYDLTQEENDKIINQLITNREVTFIRELQTKNGNNITVEINSKYFIYNNQEHVLSVVRDITERKQTENIIKKQEEKIEYNKMKMKYIANISHEFKTPLNIKFL